MDKLIKEKIEQLSFENCKKLSFDVLEYVQNNRELAYGAGALAVTVLVYKYGSSTRHRFFAWICNKATNMGFVEYEKLKKTLLEPIANEVSHDTKLREDKVINILEVGVGTGANFKYYPEGCHLVAVDPNPYFSQYYNENRSKFPHIKSAEIIVSKGEEMDMVESNSIDVVVMTLVLCSVEDVTKVLSQVKRVLAPGGKFYFSEHVLEWDKKNHACRRRIQLFLNNSGVWPFFFDGCHTARDPLPAMRDVGFSNIQENYFYAPAPCAIFRLLAPHLMGVATK